MRHLKVPSDKHKFKEFIAENIEYLILGGISAAGMLVGMLLSDILPGWVVWGTGSGEASFLNVFFCTFSAASIYIFILFFCGTSAIGFISPLVLLIYGLTTGKAICDVCADGLWLDYFLAVLPFTVLTTGIYIYLSKCNITLSLCLFRLCTGSGSANIPVMFRKFTMTCMFSLAVSSAICLLHSVIVLFVIPLF